MHHLRVLLLSCVWCLSGAMIASAQQAEPPRTEPQPQPGSSILDRGKSFSDKFEVLPGNHLRYTGGVEQDLGNQTTISADQLDFYVDTNRLEASGNVVFVSQEGRLAAERVVYDLNTGTGRFETASGLMSLGEHVDRKQFGNQEADVYFLGEIIEKLGPRKYKITRGGFTTCVQPTPRWEMTSGSVTLNLNDYAIARNTVLRVKGVPVMYLPLVYYPIRSDERATGFLMPTYGTSTVRGQALSNAFFWAINRSQDATLFHDWFTRSGQGAGAEYRYVAAAQSSGNVRFYRFSRRETQFTNNGQTNILPPANSIEVTGDLSHALARNIRARARLDYFTDIVSQQLYHQNLYQASRNSRLIEGGLTAGFGPTSTSVLYQRQEVFLDEKNTQVYGSTPRIATTLAPQRLFNAPVYTSMNAEYAFLPNQQVVNGVVVSDNGYGRLDVTPTIRMPLSRLPFLSVNASAAYRSTYYSRSVDTTSSSSSATLDDSYVRQFMTLRSEIVGPVFTRIWDLKSGFAERLKHVIEPALTIDFTSQIADYKRTPVVSDLSDFVVSGSTRFTYGLTNRFFSRSRAVDNVRGQTREFVTVGLQQTYYSNPQSRGFDSAYQSTYGRARPVDLSPVALSARVSPTAFVDTNARVEYDVSGGGLQMVSVGGSLNAAKMSAGSNYSHSSGNDFLSGTTTMRWLDGRATGSYNIGWDIEHSYIVSQAVNVSYLAQCCGLQVEFQKYNFVQTAGFPIPADTRFNFGFILAGLGTFSNFFGAFGGQR